MIVPESGNPIEKKAAGSYAMPTSPSNFFCRVNWRSPCRICGRPDSCLYVRDEILSLRMRVSDGARKINCHSGAIFTHEDRREGRAIGIRVVAGLPQPPIAHIEIPYFV